MGIHAHRGTVSTSLTRVWLVSGMSRYRRLRVPGATYFFTVNLARRESDLLTAQVDQLRHAFVRTALEEPFKVDAMVVLPDHIHAVWTLPEGDADFSRRWQKLKQYFTRQAGVQLPRSGSKQRKREAGIWQRRFWEHLVRNDTDYHKHVEYCWQDPVRHGLVDRPADWPFSSIRRDIARGLVDPGWKGSEPAGFFGEA